MTILKGDATQNCQHLCFLTVWTISLNFSEQCSPLCTSTISILSHLALVVQQESPTNSKQGHIQHQNNPPVSTNGHEYRLFAVFNQVWSPPRSSTDRSRGNFLPITFFQQTCISSKAFPGGLLFPESRGHLRLSYERGGGWITLFRWECFGPRRF